MIFKVFYKYGCIPGRKLPISCLCINVVGKRFVSSQFNRAVNALPVSKPSQEMWINVVFLCHHRLCGSWMMNPLLVSKSLPLETI